MNFRGYSSEIYLTKKHVTQAEWQQLIKTISTYNGYFRRWNITIQIENNKVRYFLNTKVKLPPSLNNLDAFLLKKTESNKLKFSHLSLPLFLPIGSNLFDIYNYCEIKKIGKLKYMNISLLPLNNEKNLSKVELYLENDDKLIKSKMLFGLPSNILSADFNTNCTFSYQNVPKYLDSNKILHTLKTDSVNSIFKVETFPYYEDDFYMTETSFDFAKHSLILGSSGCGKSKFLSLLINNIKKNNLDKYKIVMIDPHAAIEREIGGLGSTIDFKSIENSIDLFASTSNDLVATTELTLELFKSLIGEQYNSKLERVLRHSIYLLLAGKRFNFINLKNVLLDIEYRNDCLRTLKNIVPASVTYFFLQDFNDLKTKSYNEAISPIIAFIDEMEMLPVFNEEKITNTLAHSIEKNYLTLFSLDRTRIGDKVTKTISGLIMQQLLTLIQSHTFNYHIIFVIDEVAVIENPILCRFLSEARKYNLSLFLAGQYFNQVSTNLKEAILANVINYYIFRVSRIDATLLVDNLDIKIPIDNTKETKIKMLSTLNNRDCIVRISKNDILLPTFKAKTIDFKPIPRINYEQPNFNLIANTVVNKENKNFPFILTDTVKLNDILKMNSTNKKVDK